jgi:HCOMODA/2-hydroxy-3-carboxy-muconic semialdehyde decarboxylase
MGLITPDEDGAIVQIEGPLPKGVLGEVRVHQQIYKRRRDVNGVCRFLSPQILSLSGLLRAPQVRHGFGTYFAPQPKFWPSAALLRSDERASSVAEALGLSRGIILRGNGAVVAGDTLEQAVTLAWFLEDMARVELDVLRADSGSAETYSDEECRDRATFEGRVVERMWDYLTAGDPE